MIGSVDGVLAIFRGYTDTVPWRKCTALGMVGLVKHTGKLSIDTLTIVLSQITCVGVGDVLNQGKVRNGNQYIGVYALFRCSGTRIQ